MVGPKFTWRDPIYHEGQRIYEKLDKVFCNDCLSLEYLDAHVKVLIRVNFSNHHLILVCLNNNYNLKNPKAF